MPRQTRRSGSRRRAGPARRCGCLAARTAQGRAPRARSRIVWARGPRLASARTGPPPAGRRPRPRPRSCRPVRARPRSARTACRSTAARAGRRRPASRDRVIALVGIPGRARAASAARRSPRRSRHRARARPSRAPHPRRGRSRGRRGQAAPPALGRHEHRDVAGRLLEHLAHAAPRHALAQQWPGAIGQQQVHLLTIGQAREVGARHRSR